MAAQVERLTGIVIECELTTFDDKGEMSDRRPHKFGRIEAQIPKEVREWILGLCPAKPKEG